MRRIGNLLPIVLVAGFLLAAGSTRAADWPQWRGPERNGLAPDGPALANSVVGLSPLWLSDGIPSGDRGGRGGLVVYAGKVYGLVSAVSHSDQVFCLNSANGKIIWKRELQDAGKEAGSSTPCIANGMLYVVGSGASAYCLNADTGSPVWQAALPRSGREPITSSITVIGNEAILLADVLLALDARSGKVLWKQDQVKGLQSSPALWNHNGKNDVICNSARETYCVDAADGRIHWSVPGGGKSTPVVAQEYGGDFLVNMSDIRRNGLAAYRLTDKGPQKLWSMDISDRGSSPVVFDGHVYTVAGGENGHGAHLLSIHIDSGKVAWDEVIDFAEVSSPVIADGKMFVVCGTYLALLQATPEKYSLLSQDDYRITLCTSPTIVDGRLYVRQGNAVACYDLRAGS